MSQTHTNSDTQLSISERALPAAGAAFISAIVVNPLDVAKVCVQFLTVSHHQHIKGRLQSYTSDMQITYYKRVHRSEFMQEGFTRLWRGTGASLALAMPSVGIYMPCYDIFRNFMEEFTTQNAPNLTPYAPLVAGSLARSLACIACYPVELARTRMQAFKVTQSDKPPGVWKTLLEVTNPVKGTSILQSINRYRFWWTGLGAQLSRDVPFSAICWSTLEPIRRRILGLVGEEASAATVLGAIFSAGFVAGTLVLEFVIGLTQSYKTSL